MHARALMALEQDQTQQLQKHTQKPQEQVRAQVLAQGEIWQAPACLPS